MEKAWTELWTTTVGLTPELGLVSAPHPPPKPPSWITCRVPKTLSAAALPSDSVTWSGWKERCCVHEALPANLSEAGARREGFPLFSGSRGQALAPGERAGPPVLELGTVRSLLHTFLGCSAWGPLGEVRPLERVAGWPGGDPGGPGPVSSPS